MDPKPPPGPHGKQLRARMTRQYSLETRVALAHTIEHLIGHLTAMEVFLREDERNLAAKQLEAAIPTMRLLVDTYDRSGHELDRADRLDGQHFAERN